MTLNIHKNEGIDANLSNNNDKVGRMVGVGREISLQMTVFQINSLLSMLWLFCDRIFVIRFELWTLKIFKNKERICVGSFKKKKRIQTSSFCLVPTFTEFRHQCFTVSLNTPSHPRRSPRERDRQEPPTPFRQRFLSTLSTRSNLHSPFVENTFSFEETKFETEFFLLLPASLHSF